MSESNYVRVPAKLTKEMKVWLDDESKRSGIPQSTLLLLGLELLKDQRENKMRNSHSTELESKFEGLLRKLEQIVEMNKGD